jgi:hypothetical protein
VYSTADFVTWNSLGQVTLDGSGSGSYIDSGAASAAYRFYALKEGPVASANTYGFTSALIPASGSALVADQLINPTGNTLPLLFPTPPNGFQVSKWDTSSGSYESTTYSTRGGWPANASTMTLNPGEGAMIQNPNGTSLTLTFIGSVPQGSQVNSGVPGTGGQSAILSSIYPVALPLDGIGGLSFPNANGDAFDFFAPNQQYVPFSYSTRGGWSPSIPAPNVGAAFWFTRGTSSSTPWTENITVTPP